MFDLRDQPDDLRRQLERVGRQTGHPAEAVFLVFYAMIVAGRGLSDEWWAPADRRTIPEDAPVRHLTAVEVCDAVCRCARARVGAEARRYFRHFGLRTGADVGRVVYALVAEGLGATAPGDRPEQFDRVPLLKLLNPIADPDED
ncbi:MAG TPA: hypothetical protein VM597_19765 [Gemmataceae bacterium]|nr:hypothetical protein [Gemmataceae bacterium]